MARKRQKSESGQAPIYVIAAKDDSLLNMECDRLLDKLLGDTDRQTALFAPEMDKVEISEILDELRTLPFLAPKRVVLLKGADRFISDHRETLEKYFDSPCTTGILIMTVNSWPATTKLAKKLSAGAGDLISIREPKAWELPQKIMQYASDAYGKTLAKPAAELLVELAGDQLPALYGEIDKLALYAEAKKAITAQDVESLVGRNRAFNAFAVIDSITEGNVGQAVDKLRRMFDADKSAEYTFVGAFVWHLRKMFNAKVLLEKGLSQNQVAGKAKVWGNKDAFFAQVRKMPLARIAEAIKLLAQTDHDIKTGQAQPRVAAEQLIFNLTLTDSKTA
jgi:DNA polymerase-3 subunit delta